MKEDLRYFQYISGDRKGDVIVYDHIEQDDGLVFVCFKDGSRCNEELILPINVRVPGDKYMAEIENGHNIWTFKEEWVGRVEEETALNAAQERVIVTPFRPGSKKLTAVPPKKTHSSFGNITKHIKAAELATISEPKSSGDPVFLMVDKSRKFDTKISLDMVVSLPKQSLYAVVDESFEDGGSKMVDYIVDNMNIQIFKNSLKNSLLKAYASNPDKYDESATVGVTVGEGGIGYTNPAELFEPVTVEEPIIGKPISKVDEVK